MFSMLVNTLGEIGCYTDIQRSVSLAGKYINGRLHHVSAKKNLIRHSRTGGNPGLNLLEIFRDSHNFKFLDSRLRGNDAVKVAVLIKRLLLIVWIFRRPVDSLKAV